MNRNEQPTRSSAAAGDRATSEPSTERLERCPICEHVYQSDSLPLHLALHDESRAIATWAWNITICPTVVDGHPGHFLKAFAGAVARADGPHFAILKPAALQLIHKYPEYLVGEKMSLRYYGRY
jgi:hypothetical protein